VEIKSWLKNSYIKYLQGFQRGAKKETTSYNQLLHSYSFAECIEGKCI